ncbi:MAG TPA: formylglycine-generating enzyme family protein [Polyangiaceae bacterium]|nr:formylglycine-generating enzyme family protein [Polyangiaceae bacterium]
MSASAALLYLMLLVSLEQPEWLEQACARKGPSSAETSPTIRVPGGRFRPPYTPSEGPKEVDVAPFTIDRDLVTNAQFLRFVSIFPNYRRGRIAPILADAGYLAHWAGPTTLGAGADPEQPVVRVSWFSAKAYCQSRGKRLPTELEWEYVAAASETARDARREPAWQAKILSWYAKPASELGRVGMSRPNAYGVRDLHGLVWQWVHDFNSTLVSSDSRSRGGEDRQTFCGAGAIGSDSSDYASFMRMAFRSSLKADDTAQSLGFRCGNALHEDER